MKKLIQFIVLTVIVLPLSTLGEEIHFSPQEVHENVIEYLNVVFGVKEPTLQDYMRFEGIDPGYEAQLALRSCKIKFPDKEPEKSDDCGRYINSRYDNKDKVVSLYYKLLREKLAITPSSIRNAKIHVVAPNSEDDAYRVSVRFPALNRRLIIGHALRHDLAELGLVGIIEVEEISIQNYLSLHECTKKKP